MSIGWQRAYYRCTLAENWQDYLQGKSNRIKWKPFKSEDLVNRWKSRWITPRIGDLQLKLMSKSQE